MTLSKLPRAFMFHNHLRMLVATFVAAITFASASSLRAQCSTCGSSITLGGDLQLYGKGSCTISINGTEVVTMRSNEQWLPMTADAPPPTKHQLEDKKYRMGPGTSVKVQCTLVPDAGEALNLVSNGKTCICSGIGNFMSGEVKELCEEDPLDPGYGQCSDPYWEPFTGAQLNQQREFRVFLDSDPRFDPGSASESEGFSSEGESEPGEVEKISDSIAQTFSLGRHAGVPVGRIRFESPMNGTITRENFDLDLVEGQEAHVEPVVEVGGMPKQFKSEEVLITLTELPGSPSPGVKAELFSAVGAVEELDGTYTPAGAALAVYEISRVSTTVGSSTVQGIRSTDTRNGVTRVSEHYGEPALGVPGGFERERRDGEIVDVTRTPIYVGMDLAGYTTATVERRYDGSTTHVTSERIETFEKFPWGMEPAELVEDPSGAARTTTYVYYDSVPSTAPHYGKLHVRYCTDGTWERHVYNANGILTAIHRPWLTSPVDAAGVIALPASQCGVTEVTETLNPEGVGSKVMAVEKINGRMVAKRLTSKSLGLSPIGQQMLETISATYLGDGSLAQITRTGYESSGTSGAYEQGRAIYTVRPNGTTTLHEYGETGPQIGEVLPRTTMIVTEGTVDYPFGIPRQHTRTVSVSNSEGLIESRTEVALGDEDNFAVLSTQTVERETDPLIQERVYQDGVLVGTTTRLSSTTTESMDEVGLISQTITNATTGELEATIQKGLSTMGAYHDGSDVRTDSFRSGLTEFTLVHNGTTRPSIPTASTADSSRTYDKVGRLVASSEKLGSHARTYTYTIDGNGLRSEKEWHAFVTNPLRVTTYYPNGQLKSVTGEAEVGTFYTYGVDMATGLKITTVRHGAPDSPRWRRTYADALGRVVRDERPSFVQQQTVVVSHHYNGKGQRTSSVNSTMPNVAILVEYNESGQVFRQGSDLNANGKLDLLSNEPLTEYLTGYEQNGGLWWQVDRQRTYFEDGTSKVRERETRQRLGAGPASYSQTIERPGVTITTATTLTPSTRTRVVTTTRSDATNVASATEINGMQVMTKDFYEAGTPSSTNSTQYSYDHMRRLTKIQYPNSTLIVSTTYDALGRVATEKDGTTATPNTGLLVNNSYDYYPASYGLSEGLLYSKVQIPGGGSGVTPQYTYFAYNAFGQQTHTWGPGTYPVKQVYDGYGQRVELHTYRATSGSFEGDPSYSAPPNGFSLSSPDTTIWSYDAPTGLLTSKKDAMNEEVIYTYNATGLPHQRTWARGVTTTYGYNDLGLLASVVYSDSTPPVAHSYYRDGTLRTTTDAAGLLTRSRDPASGSLAQEAVTTASGGPNLLAGAVVERRYDSAGRIVWLQTRNSGGLGRVGPIAPGVVINYETAGGRLSYMESELRGVGFDYSYDQGLKRIYTAGSGTIPMANIDYYHPILGRRIKSEHGFWERQWSVASGGIKIDGKEPNSSNNGYEETTRTYQMNQRGEITAENKSQLLPQPPFGTPSVVPVEGWDTSYSYDAIGNRATSGAGFADPEHSEVSYTTNALNQYTGLANSRRTFVLGAAKNTAAVEVNGEAAVEPPIVDFDVPVRQNELFAARITSSGSDAAWVPVTVVASESFPPSTITQTGNVYLPPASETLTYDEDGNLTGDGRWTYTWDAENRLVGLSTKASAVTAGVPNLKLAFAYDAQHRRIRKKTELYNTGTSSWDTLTDLRFVYDAWNLLAEVETYSGAPDAPVGASGPYVKRSYLWGPDISGTWQGAGGVGGLLAVRRHPRGAQGVQDFSYAFDLNGNVLGLLDGGLVAQALYEYDAFGKLLRANESEEELNPFRFSTKYTDSETGFAYYGYRFYDSARGRWLNKDPIEEKGGVNMYAMARNDAVNQVDVLGLYVGFYHKKITQMGLRGTLYGVCTNHLETVMNANVSQDAGVATNSGPFADPDNHGDNGRIASTIALITTRLRDAQSKECKGQCDADEVLVLFGKILHALQDLYSHSDYTEVQDRDHFSNRATPGRIPTWPMLDGVVPPSVTSGAYKWPFDDAPPPSHKTMAKDKPSNIQSLVRNLAGETYFDLAQDLSIRGTREAFYKFQSGLRPSCKKAIVRSCKLKGQ